MKPPGLAAGHPQRGSQIWLAIQREEHGAGLQLGSQSAGKPTADNQLRQLVGQQGAEGPLGLALADAGDQHLDVAAPDRPYLERPGLFLYCKANECMRHP